MLFKGFVAHELINSLLQKNLLRIVFMRACKVVQSTCLALDNEEAHSVVGSSTEYLDHQGQKLI